MSRQDANAAFARTSFLYGGNADYIEDFGPEKALKHYEQLVASLTSSSLSDLAHRAGSGRIDALIRPFFVAGWGALEQFPHD